MKDVSDKTTELPPSRHLSSERRAVAPPEIAELVDELRALRGELSETLRTPPATLIAELRASIEEQANTIARLESERNRLQEQLRTLQVSLEAKNRAIAEREHGLECLLNSPSWKVTAPLRKIKALFRPSN